MRCEPLGQFYKITAFLGHPTSCFDADFPEEGFDSATHLFQSFERVPGNLTENVAESGVIFYLGK